MPSLQGIGEEALGLGRRQRELEENMGKNLECGFCGKGKTMQALQVWAWLVE